MAIITTERLQVGSCVAVTRLAIPLPSSERARGAHTAIAEQVGLLFPVLRVIAHQGVPQDTSAGLTLKTYRQSLPRYRNSGDQLRKQGSLHNMSTGSK